MWIEVRVVVFFEIVGDLARMLCYLFGVVSLFESVSTDKSLLFFDVNINAEIVSSFATGLTIFLLVTEHTQKPFLQFSPKRWSIITGLRGYLTSAFFTMGFKIFAPILAVYVTWPVLGLPALVYRIYQLTRATSFIEKLMFAMRGASVSPAVLDRTGALISMIVTFRVLDLVCLWSLLTFLRLFPSRPVAENY
ncbi:Hypothetical predicted protein [Olea europaea subsp. europaea]|uniref:Transmembrane protein n=1 Tax=Olea europaea subsp. europaea TaxID=158383 RepID=A0A8S0RX75_OLEEU|nr:Hypothetical predicted protein [Olea europaea subsp. europaea]